MAIITPSGSSSQINGPLPERLRPLFWDVDFSSLDWELDHNLIVRRILQDGNWAAVRWLRSTWGDAAVRGWLITHAGGRLSPRQLRYWELVLDLSGQEVNKWINLTKESPWERRLTR